MRFRPLVLCYHAVSDEWTDGMAVPPGRLVRQVRRLLGRGWRPVTAAGTLQNRARTFHVTFDDAYRSVLLVLPQLRALGVPVTVFACTGYADGGRPLLVPELVGRAAGRPHELETLGWDALADLADQGVVIGSHTVSHPHLPQLTDGELRRELRLSREELEERRARRCPLLAYPYGESDARVRAAAPAAGYTMAYSLDGMAGALDVFGLPRVDVYRKDGATRFELKCSRARTPLATALHAVRRVRGA